MQGKLPLTSAVIAITALAVLVSAPGGQGSVAARGGNHGCDGATGTVRSDHFWKGGDRVVAGYYTQEGGIPKGTQENLFAENPGTNGIGTGNAVNCHDDVGTWTRFASKLGAGDDRVRLDAVGLLNKYNETPRSLPRRVDTLLSGGGGADRLFGHRGFDRFLGGADDDLIKAADNKRDRVSCGPGDDKAFVDRHDVVSGCERVVET